MLPEPCMIYEILRNELFLNWRVNFSFDIREQKRKDFRSALCIYPKKKLLATESRKIRMQLQQ